MPKASFFTIKDKKFKKHLQPSAFLSLQFPTACQCPSMNLPVCCTPQCPAGAGCFQHTGHACLHIPLAGYRRRCLGQSEFPTIRQSWFPVPVHRSACRCPIPCIPMGSRGRYCSCPRKSGRTMASTTC